ncbi:MAG: HNH endonuclease [Acidimicrobiales bacterium]
MSALVSDEVECEVSEYLWAVARGIAARAEHPVSDYEQALVAADRVARVLAGVQARWLAEADKAGVVRRSGARNAAAWLESITGESRRDARSKKYVADATVKRPSLGRGLLDGSLNAGQVERIQRAADATEASDERIEKLIDDVKGESVKDTDRRIRELERELTSETPEERFEQQRCKRQASIGPKGDGSGMIELHALLDPVAGERVRAALAKASKQLHQGDGEQRTYRQIMADALEDLIDGINKTGLLAGTAESIPVNQIRGIACAQGVYPAVLGSNGEILDMGRRVRLATSAQKRALKARYGGCGVEGCDSCFDFCEIHHIWEWLKGGPTDLANLIPLCSRHHHLIHDQGWTLVYNADGTATLKPP